MARTAVAGATNAIVRRDHEIVGGGEARCSARALSQGEPAA
jgi:hypothetical protein